MKYSRSPHPSLIKSEASLDSHDIYLSKLASNIGIDALVASDAGFPSVQEAIKDIKEQAVYIKLMAEMG